jgi:fructose-bisphosphate aldolase class 1
VNKAKRFEIMNRQELAATAKAMVAPGKGLLAMDESNRTVTSDLKMLGSHRPKKIAVLTES